MDAIDDSWRGADKMTGVRTDNSADRATAAAAQAAAAAEAAAKVGSMALGFAPAPAPAGSPAAAPAASPAGAPAAAAALGSPEAKATLALQAAIEAKTKTKALLPEVETQAHAAARAAALRRVSRLEKEAQDYFDALMAQFESLGEPEPDPRREAIVKAAAPYYDAVLKLQTLVASYNKQATDTLAMARSLVSKAEGLATKATYEQASGFAVPAQTDMLHAHQTIADAEQRRQLAMRVRRFAENMNNAIPSYQQAAEMAITSADAAVAAEQES